jgi:Raf kinase inhibitor-like YbhB/YbcL family protein
MLRLMLLTLVVLILSACGTQPATPTIGPEPTTQPTRLPPTATPKPQPTTLPEPTIVPAPTIDSSVVPATISVTSSIFTEGGSLPIDYTCDGKNSSPALSWGALPAGTKSIALIMEDRTYENYTHWVLFNIPTELTELEADIPDGEVITAIGMHAQNAFSSPGYNGPCPDPKETNTYTFTIYALNTELPLKSDPLSPVSKGMVRDAMKGHILGEGVITAVYTRQ